MFFVFLSLFFSFFFFCFLFFVFSFSFSFCRGLKNLIFLGLNFVTISLDSSLCEKSILGLSFFPSCFSPFFLLFFSFFF